MKKIPLTLGQFALVDDEDFESLNRFKWCAMNPQHGAFYAVRNRRQSEVDLDLSMSRGERLYMMREIVGAPPHTKVRPVNGNSLDCRRANIKVVQPTAATVSRLAALRHILPCFPAHHLDLSAHPYRGLYKDERNKNAGGVLVKSFASGATKFYGPYRTVEQAMSKRDDEERKRRELGQPMIDYTDAAAKKRAAEAKLPSIVADSLGDLV